MRPGERPLPHHETALARGLNLGLGDGDTAPEGGGLGPLPEVPDEWLGVGVEAQKPKGKSLEFKSLAVLEKAKAQRDAPDAGRARAAVGGTHAPRRAFPGAAPTHAQGAVAGGSRRPIGRRAGVVIVSAVFCPFQDIPMHVV